MEQFPIGTVCIIQGLVESTHYNGMECTTTSKLKMCFESIGIDGSMRDVLAYETDAPDLDRVPGDGPVIFEPHQLRRKQPPQTFTGEQRVIELFRVTHKPDTVAA